MKASRAHRLTVRLGKQILVIVLMVVGAFVRALPQSNGLRTYSNTKYGISFRYPRGYVLKVKDLGDGDAGMGYLGPIPMEFVTKGGVRIVAVEPPADPYPGTDYVNSFFTVNIKTHLSKSACERFTDNEMNTKVAQIVKKIDGIEFHGVPIGFAGLGHQFYGHYYHGFSRGSCLEIGYGLATAGYGSVDGMKQVDAEKIDLTLKEIFSTTRVRPTR